MAGSAEELASAYLTLIPTLQGAEATINEQLGSSGIKESSSRAGDEVGGLFGEGFGKKFLAVAAPLLTVGALKEAAQGLYNIGSEFDEMTDLIIQGTGASGQALVELQDSAKEVATSVPVSFSEAGNIIQDLNTRLGLSGDALEDVATRAGALEKVAGEAANVETLAGSFAAWGVEADDMAAEMDYLYGVSQKTGIGFNDLTSIIEANAGPMKSLGFSYEETANMAGLLDKAGIDASGTMSKMAKALVELSEPGESAADAYARMISEMEAYIAAGDEASAVALASDIFGSRGAAKMVQALESGAMSFDELKDSALGAGDGIMGTFDRVASFEEKFEIFKNKLMEVIEPLASGIFEGLGAGLDYISSLFEDLDMEGIHEFMATLMEGLKPSLEAMGQAVGDLFVTLSPLLEKIGAIFAAVLPPVVELVAGAIELIVGAVEAAWPLIEPIIDLAVAAIEQIMAVVGPLVNFIVDAVNTYIVPVVQLGGEIIGSVIGAVGEALGGFLDSIGGLPGIFQAAFDLAVAIFQTAFQVIGDILSGIGQFFIDLPGNIEAAFKNLVNILTFPFRTAFNMVAEFWNNTIGQLQWDVPDWVPGIGGETIGAPKLPILGELAEGAIATRETKAIIGEGTDPEALIPLNDRGAAFAQRIGLGGPSITREDIAAGVAEGFANAGVAIHVNGKKLATATRSDYDRVGGSAGIYNRRGLANA